MDSSLISILVNLGTGGVVVVLMILGFLIPKPSYTRVLEESAKKDEVITKLEDALALERQRSNDATQAGAVTNQLIGGLVKLASGHHDEAHALEHDAGDGTSSAGTLDLTARNPGL